MVFSIITGLIAYFLVGRRIIQTRRGSWSWIYITLLMPPIWWVTKNPCFLAFFVGAGCCAVLSLSYERERVEHILFATAIAIAVGGILLGGGFWPLFFSDMALIISLYPLAKFFWDNPGIARNSRIEFLLFSLSAGVGTDWTGGGGPIILVAIPLILNSIILSLTLRKWVCRELSFKATSFVRMMWLFIFI